jgi:NADH dehydrogenase
VKVELNTKVTDYDGEKLSFDGKEPFHTETVIWTAGVSSNPVDGMPTETIMKGSRLLVDSFLKVKNMENIFAMGDVAGLKSEDLPKGHPMLAAVAIQQGEYLGKYFKKKNGGKQIKPFTYIDKGTMATIGRNKAVADLKKSKISGFSAWIVWLFVHLFYLIGFRNKVSVFSSWFYNYFTYDKALRLIIRPYKKS